MTQFAFWTTHSGDGGPTDPPGSACVAKLCVGFQHILTGDDDVRIILRYTGPTYDDAKAVMVQSYDMDWPDFLVWLDAKLNPPVLCVSSTQPCVACDDDVPITSIKSGYSYVFCSECELRFTGG